ncbi:MAG: hypothetical protein V4697_02930 [Patescibacteria group bacterium]
MKKVKSKKTVSKEKLTPAKKSPLDKVKTIRKTSVSTSQTSVSGGSSPRRAPAPPVIPFTPRPPVSTAAPAPTPAPAEAEQEAHEEQEVQEGHQEQPASAPTPAVATTAVSTTSAPPSTVEEVTVMESAEAKALREQHLANEAKAKADAEEAERKRLHDVALAAIARSRETASPTTPPAASSTIDVTSEVAQEHVREQHEQTETQQQRPQPTPPVISSEPTRWQRCRGWFKGLPWFRIGAGCVIGVVLLFLLAIPVLWWKGVNMEKVWADLKKDHVTLPESKAKVSPKPATTNSATPLAAVTKTPPATNSTALVPAPTPATHEPAMAPKSVVQMSGQTPGINNHSGGIIHTVNFGCCHAGEVIERVKTSSTTIIEHGAPWPYGYVPDYVDPIPAPLSKRGDTVIKTLPPGGSGTVYPTPLGEWKIIPVPYSYDVKYLQYMVNIGSDETPKWVQPLGETNQIRAYWLRSIGTDYPITIKFEVQPKH